jgi:hypothetical protein
MRISLIILLSRVVTIIMIFFLFIRWPAESIDPSLTIYIWICLI